jgi:hypothetical protein
MPILARQLLPAVALEDFYGRRLARSVGPQDCEYLAVFDIEVQIPHSL